MSGPIPLLGAAEVGEKVPCSQQHARPEGDRLPLGSTLQVDVSSTLGLQVDYLCLAAHLVLPFLLIAEPLGWPPLQSVDFPLDYGGQGALMLGGRACPGHLELPLPCSFNFLGCLVAWEPTLEML